MRDILRLIQENKNLIKPTPLLRRSNISSTRFKGYLSELLEKNLIKEVIDKKEEKFISLTEKGFKFLEKYRVIINFIDEFDL